MLTHQNRYASICMSCSTRAWRAKPRTALKAMSVTLKYRLSEKVATPTSVTLMAFNAVLGFALHALVLQDMQMEAYRFWWVSIPVVVFGAPLGAYVVSRVPRLYIAALLYTVIVVQFGTALWVIQPALPLLLFSAGVFAFGVVLFFQLPRWGPVSASS